MLVSLSMRMLALLTLATLMPAGPAGSMPPETPGPLVVESDSQSGSKALFWLQSSLKRVYLQSDPGPRSLEPLLAPRNGQISFQACVRNDRSLPLKVECSVSGDPGLQTRVRRVGYVPMRLGTTDTPASELEFGGESPGFVPDPLYNEQAAQVGPYENAAFWVTVQVPAAAAPAEHELKVSWTFQDAPNWRVHEGSSTVELPVVVDVSQFTVKPRRDFPVVHWFRGEALWDYYKTGMWEDPRIWEITRNYMENLLDHGTDVIMVPLFFARRETFERPCQLLIVDEPEQGKYTFDFSLVKRYVDLAKSVGFDKFEWSHFWIYWGARNPVRVYTQKDGKYVMLWPPDSDGHGPEFHSFLKQFLPPFHEFLLAEGILENSYFHISDEPGEGEHITNYRKGRDFLSENAPWMKGKIMDALSSIEYGRQKLNDIPIPIINSAQPFIDENIPHWVYFCTLPRGEYLQRLLDTPLPKIRMSGFLFYKLGAKGFLHWGYNYWHALEQEKLIDPFADATAADWPWIPAGDPFVVYPGPDGRPIDSIRWEVFAESLQDYAILQTAGIPSDDPNLADIKGYADFPKTEEWIRDRIRWLLTEGASGAGTAPGRPADADASATVPR